MDLMKIKERMEIIPLLQSTTHLIIPVTTRKVILIIAMDLKRVFILIALLNFKILKK